MNIGNKLLFEATKLTKANLEQLLDCDKGCSKHIITIDRSVCEGKKVLEILAKYEPFSKRTDYPGNTWLLVGKNENEVFSLNVAQSTNFLNEISLIIGDIINWKSDYSKLLELYDELSFYEVDIEKYIEFLGLNKEELKEIAYELTKDYLAEFLIAKNTAANYWNYYRSGMDKRYYDYFTEKN